MGTPTQRRFRKVSELEGESSERSEQHRVTSETVENNSSPDECEHEREDGSLLDSRRFGDDASAVRPGSDENLVNEILAEADSQQQMTDAEAVADSSFAETWTFDSIEVLLEPEELFSKEYLKGKM